MRQIAFDPTDPKAALAQLPQAAAVFALYGAEAHAEPYIGHTPNLRARLERLLQPSPKHPRRLQLAGRVRRIEFRLAGSDFESLLLQFEMLEKVYGTKCLDRMHLRAPAFIRYLGSNAYPRITITHRPSQREADWAYGPFSSRAAAERFADEALKLFLLRRCTDDLDPNPAHPGCVYSEMKMCLAPCYKGCTDERYSQESSAVEQFLSTRGESRLVTLRTQRDQASADLEFESAAALHAQVQRVESVRALAPELVRPLSQLRAVILQASASPDEVAVFLYENGRLNGPAAFSTLGMRIQNEQSGSSSLFAQPMAIEPIPEEPNLASQLSSMAVHHGPNTALQAHDLKGHGYSRAESAQEEERALHAAEKPKTEGGGGFNPLIEPAESGSALAAEGHFHPISPETLSLPAACLAPEGNLPAASPETSPHPAKLPRGLLESRLETALTSLSGPADPPSATERQGHLALLKRWYYRTEVRRSGEIFFPDPEGHWPIKPILRGIGRVAAKMLTPAHRA